MGDWGDEVKGEEEKKEGKFLPTGGRMDWQASKVEQEFVADLKILKSHCNIIALVNFGAARSLAALIDNWISQLTTKEEPKEAQRKKYWKIVVPRLQMSFQSIKG